jgi:hypothetical protein
MSVIIAVCIMGSSDGHDKVGRKMVRTPGRTAGLEPATVDYKSISLNKRPHRGK